MAILTKSSPWLTLLSLAHCINAAAWNGGLAVAKRDSEAPSYNYDHHSNTCMLTPLGHGKDDTDNVGSFKTIRNLILHT
jgi:hypothetical protein